MIKKYSADESPELTLITKETAILIYPNTVALYYKYLQNIALQR